MRRSTVRILALFILVLLGAPVATHVVLHDLHEHHHAHADAAMIDNADHGDHEHPITGSPAPAALRLARKALRVVVIAAPQPVTRTLGSSAHRNVLSLGALRTDDDVGLQPLLSTFLI